MKRILLIVALGITQVTHSMEPIEAPIPAPIRGGGVIVSTRILEQLSVQDLIDRNELPALNEIGQLDLSKKDLTSLLGLENIPNPEQIIDLFFEENKIVYIPDHAFDLFVNLKNLDLRSNPLIQIQPHLFDMLINLEELHLQDTFIVEIPPHAFDTLRKLKTLHLFDNKIESLPTNILRNLHDLEELDIDGNNLTALESNLLENQFVLKKLFLKSNSLTQLPKITHLSHLKELYIRGNPNITELTPEEIAFILQHHVYLDAAELLGEIPYYSAGQLIADLGDDWQNVLIVPDPHGDLVLNLDNRGLTDLSGLPELLRLIEIEKVSAKNNYVKTISADFLNYGIHDLRHQGLKPLQRFPELNELDLSNNLIEELSISGFYENRDTWTDVLRFSHYCPFLLEINLSHNRITKIPKGVFNGLRMLLVLSLERNQIEVIEDGAFNGLGRLWWLDLSRNKLHVLPRMIFQNMYRVSDLDLTYNNLGNKEQYVFPPKADVEFYPQEVPMLKLLAAKKIATGFEGKNIIGVYKSLQAIPQELHEAILTAASKNVAIKIQRANRINWIFHLIAKDPEIINRNIIAGWPTILEGWPKDMQEAIFALAPEELRAKLIQLGFGSNIPASGGNARQQAAPEAGEESEEETFEFMGQ